MLGTDFGLYKSIEAMAWDRRPADDPGATLDTIANMGVEVGAKFALFEYDDKVGEWLETRVLRPYLLVAADDDCRPTRKYTGSTSRTWNRWWPSPRPGQRPSGQRGAGREHPD